MDWVVLEVECPRVDSVKEAFSKCNKLDGVIVVLDEDPSAVFQLISDLVNQYSRLAVIAVSSRTDLLVQAHRRGARSLLELPISLEDLSVALRNLASGISLQRPPRGQVIAMLPSRGGIGTTSIAVNLGAVLAAEPHNQVVLIDLDLTTGAADIALDLVPIRRLTDVAPNVDQMDFLSLRSALAKHDSGLFLLAKPNTIRDVDSLDPTQVQRVITLLRIASTHVILDLSKGWNATDLLAMQVANVILLIVQPELASIRNAHDMLVVLEEEGLTERVRLVLNRVGGEFGGDAIGIKRVEDVLGRPINWQLPEDMKAMNGAWNAGAPLVQFAPKSKIHQAIHALAGELAVKAERRR